MHLRAVAAALFLTLPTLFAGLAVDDFLLRAKTRGQGGTPTSSPFDLFSFVGGDPRELRFMMDHGIAPWFSAEGLKLRFLRPLSSLLHWVDFRLWPQSAGVMHAESLLWFGALCALTALLYRRLIEPAWAAGLAALMFAVDDAHGIPAGWISNRNSLVAGTFAVAALLAHDRWRRDGWRKGRLLGPLLLALGLCSAEVAVGTAGYLFAYALFLDPAPRRARAASLLPYAGVLAVWSAVYRALGCGAHGSGGYVDPANDLGRFLGTLPGRMLSLLLGQLALPPSDVSTFAPPIAAAVHVIALLFLAWLGYVAAPLLRRDPAARFFALGMVLAAVPCCSTFSADRLLMLAGIGGMGLVAQVLAALADRATFLPRERRYRAAAAALAPILVFTHLVFAPLFLVFSSNAVGLLWTQVEVLLRAVELGPDIERKTLVLVNAPNAFFGYLWALPKSDAARLPALGACLSVSEKPVTAVRVDARTLVVRPEGGLLLEITSRLFRAAELPFRVGDRVRLAMMTVTVTATTSDGRPAEASFLFDVPLEDPSLLWLTWNGARYVSFTPPPVGAEIVIPSGSFP
jgi:hypothetical protein